MIEGLGRWLLRIWMVGQAMVLLGCVAQPEGVQRSQSAVAQRTRICHVPADKPCQAHTIVVAQPAVAAHLAHGDRLEACEDTVPGPDAAADAPPVNEPDSAPDAPEPDATSDTGCLPNGSTCSISRDNCCEHFPGCKSPTGSIVSGFCGCVSATFDGFNGICATKLGVLPCCPGLTCRTVAGFTTRGCFRDLANIGEPCLQDTDCCSNVCDPLSNPRVCRPPFGQCVDDSSCHCPGAVCVPIQFLDGGIIPSHCGPP
jgi:hypothetical protein